MIGRGNQAILLFPFMYKTEAPSLFPFFHPFALRAIAYPYGMPSSSEALDHSYLFPCSFNWTNSAFLGTGNPFKSSVSVNKDIENNLHYSPFLLFLYIN